MAENELAHLKPKPRRNDLASYVETLFGLAQRGDRPNVIPVPDSEGEWLAPNWLYELAAAAALPSHALQGGQFTGGDVVDMGLTVGGAGLAGSLPKQATKATMKTPRRAVLGMSGAMDDYRGNHTAPGRAAYAEEAAASLDDLARIYPDDIYGPKAAQYYGHVGGADPVDRETVRILRRVRGKPDAEITVYRAVPKGKEGINKGDWVTVNRRYAETHGESALGGDYAIVEKKVKVRDLFTDANSIHEFGYDPE